jgi:hypothetical protein
MIQVRCSVWPLASPLEPSRGSTQKVKDSSSTSLEKPESTDSRPLYTSSELEKPSGFNSIRSLRYY